MVSLLTPSSPMIHSILKRRNIPLYAGLALGAVSAYYATRRSFVQIHSESPSAINPQSFTDLPIKETKFVSHNVKEITLELPADNTLGGKVAYMVLFKHIGENGKPIIRPYTPISEPNALGEAVFTVKAYPEGKMSPYLHSLKVGDKISVKGPIQKYNLEQNQHKKIALLGGGTGITPLFQILEKVANDPNDKTNVQLFFANNTPEDVILKKEIDALVAKKPEQLGVTYFVAKPDDSWKGETGFITKEYLGSHLFKPTEENVKVFVCGPPAFYKAISGDKVSPSDQGELVGALKDLSFTKDHVFKF
ncbi:cytochrome-b5 reductase [Starmerella bacillaris]|uniref:NADH-cytochrome b5 reductase n=1 Tax=Starmerella bacillaris TaxID=1247836 RepID=A0AAV5RK29_STABA|nr:cytochrome-b5 reductase [Starmerella bacillaris]